MNSFRKDHLRRLQVVNSQLYDFLLPYSQHIWVLCAVTSLSTSKYLLVDKNLHYPLHLQVLHHGSAMALQAIVSLLQNHHNHTPAQASRWLQRIFQIGSSCLEVLAAACILQGILHFQTIPIITMLPVTSFLLERLITLALDPNVLSRFNIISSMFLFLSCGGILYGEYRLTVLGLIFSIPAFIVLGVLRYFYKDREGPSSIMLSHEYPDIVGILSGCAIVAVWAMSTENSVGVLQALTMDLIPVLLINLTSSCIAIVLGKSIAIPFLISDQSTAAPYLLILTGATGCISVMFLNRSYITALQALSYTLAITILSGSSLLKPFGLAGSASRSEPTLPSHPVDIDLAYRGNPTSDKRKLSGHEQIAFASGLAAWTIFLLLNFSSICDPIPHQPTLKLDHNFTPPVENEVVISMYHETLPTLSSLISSIHDIPSLSNARVHVYTKDPFANITTIKEITGVDAVSQLPNIGREGETYLYHIMSQWDSLANHTLFLQADVHNMRESLQRIRQYFIPERTGMLSLGFAGHVCDCDECTDRWGWSDHSGVLHRMYGLVNDVKQCRSVLLSYKGQFIVSAKRIRGIDLAIYKSIWEALVDEASWMHQEKYLQGRRDSLNAPDFGYTLERLWNVLFQCSDTDRAWKCASLLSGKRQGGDEGDCQCFDDGATTV